MNQYRNDNLGTILLADDEPTFLVATSELLRNEGYICDCAANGTDALKILSAKEYDLLVADIKMPGNSNLELIKEVNNKFPLTNIILVTAYPSQQTAIEAIGLKVSSYVVKPFDFETLIKDIRSAIKTSKLSKIVKKTKNNLSQWINEMEYIEYALEKGKCDMFENSLNSFLIINSEKITEIFDNIKNISNLIADIKPDAEACDVMQCPKLSELTDGLVQAVTSIEKTKDLYKSKQLGILRTKLEKLLDET
jgi:DNA-binding response OmpR family regulator